MPGHAKKTIKKAGGVAASARRKQSKAQAQKLARMTPTEKKRYARTMGNQKKISAGRRKNKK